MPGEKLKRRSLSRSVAISRVERTGVTVIHQNKPERTMKSATVIAFVAAMSVTGAYAAEPAKPAAAGEKPAAMGDKAMPMQVMEGCEGMQSPNQMKGDPKDAQGAAACRDGMSADHMQQMHEHMQDMQDMHGGKDGMQGMGGMKSMGGMPQSDAAAKDAKPKATAGKGDKAAPPACDGKDSKGMPCAANAAPADDGDHAAHHPQPPAK